MSDLLKGTNAELYDIKKELEESRRELAVLSALSGLEREENERLRETVAREEDRRRTSLFDGQELSREEEDIDTYDIYLTFDDGPSGNTDEILTILREYDVKATFFVNGREDDESLQRYSRIVQAGHTLGMHSYSHKYVELYASKDSFTADFYSIRNLIMKTTGVEPLYYRFPGGSSNHVVNSSTIKDYIDILHENGVEYIDWNIDSGDGQGESVKADIIINNVFKDFGRYKTNVVLMHDGIGHEETVKALPSIIERARNMGARLLPLTQEAVSVKHLR
jgi:peptidoglycan/xylan/chitin deacetylase (PgdA/CDA1 family)